MLYFLFVCRTVKVCLVIKIPVLLIDECRKSSSGGMEKEPPEGEQGRTDRLPVQKQWPLDPLEYFGLVTSQNSFKRKHKNSITM